MFSKNQFSPRMHSFFSEALLVPGLFFRSAAVYVSAPFFALDEELEVFKKLLISSQELLHSRIREKGLSQWGDDDNFYYYLRIHTHVNSISDYSAIFNRIVFDTRRMQIALIFMSLMIPAGLLFCVSHFLSLSFFQKFAYLVLAMLAAPKIAMALISHVVKKFFLIQAVIYANKASQLIAKKTFYSVNAIRKEHGLTPLTIQVDQHVVNHNGEPFDLTELTVAMPIVLSGKGGIPSEVVLDASNKRRTRAGSNLESF